MATPRANTTRTSNLEPGQEMDEGAVYVISVASRLLSMHPQTLRKYERAGFVMPSRTIGNLRLYSDEDIQRLRQIKYLVEVQGVNLAGVEMALAIGALVRRLLAVTEQAEDIEWLRREVEAVSRDMLALIGAPEMSRPTGSSSQMEYRATSPRRGEYDRQR